MLMQNGTITRKTDFIIEACFSPNKGPESWWKAENGLFLSIAMKKGTHQMTCA